MGVVVLRLMVPSNSLAIFGIWRIAVAPLVQCCVCKCPHIQRGFLFQQLRALYVLSAKRCRQKIPRGEDGCTNVGAKCVVKL
jgi:hypothetical protein